MTTLLWFMTLRCLSAWAMTGDPRTLGWAGLATFLLVQGVSLGIWRRSTWSQRSLMLGFVLVGFVLPRMI